MTKKEYFGNVNQGVWLTFPLIRTAASAWNAPDTFLTPVSSASLALKPTLSISAADFFQLIVSTVSNNYRVRAATDKMSCGRAAPRPCYMCTLYMHKKETIPCQNVCLCTRTRVFSLFISTKDVSRIRQGSAFAQLT